jgi:thiazole synthase ThiGH ThiG subunit
MQRPDMKDQLTLYGQSFSSRLLLGTARFDSPSLLADAISTADPAMLTVSVRRATGPDADAVRAQQQRRTQEGNNALWKPA